MGGDVAVRDHSPATVRLSTEQLQYIAHTEFVPKSMRGKLPAILACVATGRSLGLSDMSALRSINIIDGKASFSAELMVSLVRERGHSIQGNFSGESCTVTGKRADNGDEMSCTWTLEMAKNAGLVGKDNWKKYPPSMLWARAVSQLCRMLFADCFAGATYTPDELERGADDADWTYGPTLDAGEARVALGPGAQAVDEISGLEPVAVKTPIEGVSVVSAASTEEQPSGPEASAAQKKKLNVLVGQLREKGQLKTEHLWTACGREPVLSDDGELHWSPLRDSLSKDEASGLIERLETFQATLAGAEAA